MEAVYGIWVLAGFVFFFWFVATMHGIAKDLHAIREAVAPEPSTPRSKA
ncbi:MAG TPA: hypothetical protein VM841_01995 [Actinomycetota bacterium]|nr:hypothetical protein [Actinomycetota bacterium]